MKPFHEGKRGFYTGSLSNPYPKNSIRHRDWEYGFNVAYFENLKRVKEYESKRNKKTFAARGGEGLQK